MNCSIRAINLNVAFGQSQILKNIDYTARAKGINVIIGRSGSGKSTLLRQFNLLNQVFPGYAASGSVQVNLGNGLQEIMGYQPVCEVRRKAGMVFQTPDSLPVSIRRNVLIPLKVVAGISGKEAEAKLESSLKQAGLWQEVKDRLNSPAESLSGGQKQRLCLARILALNPAVLLLDEPTASLDVVAAGRIEDLLMEQAYHLPIVMVTHNPEQASRLAASLAVMADGNLRQIDATGLQPREILELL